MCLSQAPNEKLCTSPFAELVADLQQPSSPPTLSSFSLLLSSRSIPSSYLLPLFFHLLPPLCFSPPDRREVLIRGAVDSAALDFFLAGCTDLIA